MLTHINLEYKPLKVITASQFRLSTNDTSMISNLFNELFLNDTQQSWFWTAEWQAGERKVDEYIREGEIETFDTMEEFLHTLQE